MPNKDALNTLLTLIKRTLILQREDKQTLTCEDIKRIIKQQQELEKYIAKKNNKVTKHQKKWSEFLLI
jgi:predicted nucleic acid-binding OB-fold protein